MRISYPEQDNISCQVCTEEYLSFQCSMPGQFPMDKRSNWRRAREIAPETNFCEAMMGKVPEDVRRRMLLCAGTTTSCVS